MKDPSEFNIHEVRGWIIERFQRIERAMDVLILDYFQPEHPSEFEQVMLNSSILNIGSKIKILTNIKAVSNKTLENIRKSSSIRNGFAHAMIEDVGMIRITLSRTKDEVGSVEANDETQLDVMDGQGKIITKLAVDYFAEFQKLYEELELDLPDLSSRPHRSIHIHTKGPAL